MPRKIEIVNQSETERLTYSFSFSNIFEVGETISSVVWSSDAGITIDGTSNTTNSISVRVSGGTEDNIYDIKAVVTSSIGEIYTCVLTVQIDRY